MVRRSGKESSFHFAGWVSDPRPLLQQASVLVITSDDEGQGFAAIEAMALGVPVVATAVGGLTEVIDDGSTGMLCTPRSVESVSEAVSRVLADERSPASWRCPHVRRSKRPTRWTTCWPGRAGSTWRLPMAKPTSILYVRPSRGGVRIYSDLMLRPLNQASGLRVRQSHRRGTQAAGRDSGPCPWVSPGSEPPRCHLHRAGRPRHEHGLGHAGRGGDG